MKKFALLLIVLGCLLMFGTRVYATDCFVIDKELSELEMLTNDELYELFKPFREILEHYIYEFRITNAWGPDVNTENGRSAIIHVLRNICIEEYRVSARAWVKETWALNLLSEMQQEVISRFNSGYLTLDEYLSILRRIQESAHSVDSFISFYLDFSLNKMLNEIRAVTDVCNTTAVELEDAVPFTSTRLRFITQFSTIIFGSYTIRFDPRVLEATSGLRWEFVRYEFGTPFSRLLTPRFGTSIVTLSWHLVSRSNFHYHMRAIFREVDGFGNIRDVNLTYEFQLPFPRSTGL